ncbi:hypothetical protein AVEN_82043-1 [Araneus ventricosus]|uniref:Uncharacterized protein n=1 Tax=Araneus ventricosus TaxID=182803 RepID=A0A4Y2KFG7_ARAVE|nr:hypothetical protein AVEN_82043-1 [Araneus ventricosus]
MKTHLILNWRHIVERKPADLHHEVPMQEELVKSLWWEGQTTVTRPIEDWPVSETIPDFDVVNSEKKKKNYCVVTNTTNETIEYFSKVSSFRK